MSDTYWAERYEAWLEDHEGTFEEFQEWVWDTTLVENGGAA